MSKLFHQIYEIEFEMEVDSRWIAEISMLSGAMAYGMTKSEAKLRVLKIADSLSL